MPGFQKRLVTLPLSEAVNENEKKIAATKLIGFPNWHASGCQEKVGWGTRLPPSWLGPHSTRRDWEVDSWAAWSRLSCFHDGPAATSRGCFFNWKYYLSLASTIATILWWTGYVCNTQCVHWLHLQRLQDQSNWQEDYQVFMKWIEI